MTQIIVAIIGGLAIVSAASIPVLWQRRHIGKSNGQGTVVAMLERSLSWQALHQEQDRQFQLWVAKQLGVEPSVIQPAPVDWDNDPTVEPSARPRS